MPPGSFEQFFICVFQNTFISRKGKNKAVFEERVFIAHLKNISKCRGLVQVSEKKLGFSFSLHEQMFLSVSLARSHGKGT